MSPASQQLPSSTPTVLTNFIFVLSVCSTKPMHEKAASLKSSQPMHNREKLEASHKEKSLDSLDGRSALRSVGSIRSGHRWKSGIISAVVS